MDKIICTYCNNEFKTKCALTRHQQTAKYCLKLRGESASESYTCKVCKRNFTRKNGYEQHIAKCKHVKRIDILESENKKLEAKVNTLEALLSDYKERITELQNTIERVAIKGVEKSTTNNTQTINLIPLTEEHMKNCAQYLTLDHIKQGAEGYAKYALEYPFKDRVQCVDKSRCKIKYKIEEGHVVTDHMMSKLAPKFFKCIEAHNDQLIDEFIEEIKMEIEACLESKLKTKWEEEDRDDKLDKMNEMISMLYEYKGGVKRSIEQDDRMKSDFVNRVIRFIQ